MNNLAPSSAAPCPGVQVANAMKVLRASEKANERVCSMTLVRLLIAPLRPLDFDKEFTAGITATSQQRDDSDDDEEFEQRKAGAATQLRQRKGMGK